MKEYHIDEMRHILQLVKKYPTLESPDGRYLYRDFLDVMGNICFYCVEELAPQLYELLPHENEHIREEVVATLGYSTRLGIKEFQLKSYDIWLHDPF